jgi:hypothetical protein
VRALPLEPRDRDDGLVAFQVASASLQVLGEDPARRRATNLAVGRGYRMPSTTFLAGPRLSATRSTDRVDAVRPVVTNALSLACLGLLLLALAGTARAQDAAANCWWSAPPLRVNETIRVSLRVFGAQTCGRTLVPSSSSRRSVILERLVVASRPRNGVAAIAGVSGYGYRPNPGFRGRDRFTLELRLTEDGVRGVTRIEIDVVVE